jgi:hypothetical protein
VRSVAQNSKPIAEFVFIKLLTNLQTKMNILNRFNFNPSINEWLMSVKQPKGKNSVSFCLFVCLTCLLLLQKFISNSKNGQSWRVGFVNFFNFGSFLQIIPKFENNCTMSECLSYLKTMPDIVCFVLDRFRE